MKLHLWVSNMVGVDCDATADYIDATNWTAPEGVTLDGQTLSGESASEVFTAYKSLAEAVAAVGHGDIDSDDAAAPVLTACPHDVRDPQSGGSAEAIARLTSVESDTYPTWATAAMLPRSYTLHMSDDGGSSEVAEISDLDESTIHEEIETWCGGGEWGDSGASIDCRYTVEDEDGETISEGSHIVDIEPDHDVLIKAAGGNTDCDHDWTGEGEGGCDENPGVWSTGGTSMSFARHCRKCGLHRTEYWTGSQKNPGEHDTFTYEQPDSWCAQCESEECRGGHEIIRHSVDGTVSMVWRDEEAVRCPTQEDLDSLPVGDDMTDDEIAQLAD